MRSSILVAVLMAIIACKKQDPTPTAIEEPAPRPLPSPSPQPTAPSAAPATPTCEDAADTTLRILARALPELEPAGREGLIDQCRIHPWDDEERRCMAAAEQLPDKDLLAALGACHSDGDCRRHPDRKACLERP